jgi:hypothetical protein
MKRGLLFKCPNPLSGRLVSVRRPPSTSPAGIAAKIDVALTYSPYTEEFAEDYPWKTLLGVIKELKGAAGRGGVTLTEPI